ncbi:MAG: ATP-binding protein [Chryseolinea sp.]
MAEPAQDQLIYLLIIGTAGVLLLLIFVVAFFFMYQNNRIKAEQQKQKREREFQNQMVELQLDSQEKERVRIASDLHDSLGSLLWAAKLSASFIERSMLLEGDVKLSHQELMNALEQSQHMVRRIAWELTPEAFHSIGLSESLAKICERVNGKGILVTLEEHNNQMWQGERALLVFRVVQELLSNCIKHAKATELVIRLHWSEDTLLVNVCDNGIGFNLTQTRPGVGWWNIEHRIRQLKGKIDMGVTPAPRGTSILLTIPLHHEE